MQRTSQTAMAAQDPAQLITSSPHGGKRKFISDGNELSLKKRRVSAQQTEAPAQTRTQTSTPAASTYSQVNSPLLAKLGHKFDVKTMSVMPSTSISNHVDRALEHLGRFNPWDQTVLPGVVLLCAKSAAASKLTTIAELIRRRIGESEQKWFQYNVLNEVVLEEATPAAGEPSVIEDTVVAADQEHDAGEDDNEEYFETRQPTIHEQAVNRPKVRYQVHMSVLLSRVPLDELKTEPHISLQTNEQRIDYLRKKKMGLAG